MPNLRPGFPLQPQGLPGLLLLLRPPLAEGPSAVCLNRVQDAWSWVKRGGGDLAHPWVRSPPHPISQLVVPVLCPGCRFSCN